MTRLRTARAKSAYKILSSWKAENLEPYGHDIEALARLLYDEGFLHWDSPEARALISALKNDDID